jgi:LysM repeat protein
MNRTGLTALACALAAVPLTVAACGSSDGSASATLPPIQSTTSSTVLLTTTTVFVAVTYVIQSGDGLGNIADQFGVDIDTLAILNGITNYNDIEAGEVLNIPPPTSSTSTVPVAST